MRAPASSFPGATGTMLDVSLQRVLFGDDEVNVHSDRHQSSDCEVHPPVLFKIFARG